MNRKKESYKISLELFEEHDEVNYYSFKIDNNQETEADRFFDKIEQIADDEDNTIWDEHEYSCQDELDFILDLIDEMGENGASIHYFREAGKKSDNVAALPHKRHLGEHIRIYCILQSKDIVILGNGGVKTTRTYNEDPHLNECARIMEHLYHFIKSRLYTTQLSIYQGYFYGNQTFYIPKTNVSDEKKK